MGKQSGLDRAINNPSQSTGCFRSTVELKYQPPFAKPNCGLHLQVQYIMNVNVFSCLFLPDVAAWHTGAYHLLKDTHDLSFGHTCLRTDFIFKADFVSVPSRHALGSRNDTLAYDTLCVCCSLRRMAYICESLCRWFQKSSPAVCLSRLERIRSRKEGALHPHSKSNHITALHRLTSQFRPLDQREASIT